MSRIGKKPISIPDGITVTLEERKFSVKGPKGELREAIPPELAIRVENSTVFVEVKKETKATPALWGLTRALVSNMVEGVTQGFSKRLEIHGVGYRANVEGSDLVLSLGFSHPVKIFPPPGISFSVEKNMITIAGIDKQLVGETAAVIRRKKPPEPYKGKGIRYEGEVVRRKAGKKAATTTG